MTAFAGLGLGGMFLSAFLAATILPLGSEAILVLLLAQDFDPVQVIGAATVGNVLGSLVNYWMGLAGSEWAARKISQISPGQVEQARARFQSWGTASLLLAWVPVIGDPLTLAAGGLRVNLGVFICLVTLGKFFRYLVLAGAVLSF
ncbi:MAG: DedA family protein [Desulfobacter sp.]|nr:MAG: DedA family protein [Desulfobacter sp.]